MELHALELMLPVPDAHNYAVLGPCGYFEDRRHGFPLNDERVVTCGFEGVGKTCEDCPAVVMDHRRFAVHKIGRTYHVPAESVSDGLMPQADSKNRYFPGKMS